MLQVSVTEDPDKHRDTLHTEFFRQLLKKLFSTCTKISEVEIRNNFGTFQFQAKKYPGT